MAITPRDRVVYALEGQAVYPCPRMEHGVDSRIIEEAYGIGLNPLTDGDPHSFNRHLQMIEREIEINQQTGRCNIEIPYHYTMAPRIRAGGSNHGLLTDWGSLKTLRLALVELSARHWDNLKRLIDKKRDYAVGACISTGIGHIWQTMELMAFSIAAHDDPRLLRAILEIYTSWTCRVISVCNHIGVDFFWAFDDFAFKTGPIYSPQLLREVVMPYARAVAAEMKLPWVFHSDGNFMAVLDDIVSLGMNALNPLEPGCMDVDYLTQHYPNLVLIGGIDIDVLARGTPDEVRAMTRACFRTMNPNGKYAPSSCNSIARFAKPENVRAMFDEIAECGKCQPRAGSSSPPGGRVKWSLASVPGFSVTSPSRAWLAKWPRWATMGSS